MIEDVLDYYFEGRWIKYAIAFAAGFAIARFC